MGIEKNMSQGEIEQETERLNALVKLKEQQRMIEELKSKYGSDWKKFIPSSTGGKTVKSGIDWQAIKFQL